MGKVLAPSTNAGKGPNLKFSFTLTKGLTPSWYWKLLSTPRYRTYFIKSVWACIFGWYCRSSDELMKVLGLGKVLKWHELHISWIARRICYSPPQKMWPVWENEFLTSGRRFEKKWKWSPDNWKWIWESESEFEKANRGACASRSNSTLFALLTHFLPRKRDSSKSILCHTQIRPRSSTQSFPLSFGKMMINGMYDNLKAMSKKFLRLWIQGFYLSRDDPIQGFSFVY